MKTNMLMHTPVYCEVLEIEDFEDRVDGRITLRWTLGKEVMRIGDGRD
jgi:hypothetical protein